MTEIKLIALDLDNTLFDDEKRVSKANKEAIKKATQIGVKVVITTGRPLKAIGDLLEELDLNHPMDYSVTFNGGLIQRNDGHILAQQALSRNEVVTIYQQLSTMGLPVDILSEETVYSLSGPGRPSRYSEANPLLTFKKLDRLADLPEDIIYNKVVVVTDKDFLDDKIKEMPAMIFNDFEAFKSREIIFEIMPKGVHKASGLAELCSLLGINRENVMTVGDEENDLTMIDWAGLGVAMNNAAPIVKETAKAITENDNNHSGVAEAIEKYVLSGEKDGII
ncbi:Cof-type HAD-IIB family hydrolase [Streptococcus sp. ZJ151]|uniref:Cof-type HAD-IIB family hydrolase n=1 Tax=Streptococcus jiangjianxini TaxID=3161189 RepID=UPI0032ECB5F0